MMWSNFSELFVFTRFDMGEFIGLVSVILVFGIPVIGILTHHQRKMAELIHGKNNQSTSNSEVLFELRRMNERLMILEDKVNQNTINADMYATPPGLSNEELEQRVSDK